MNLILNYLLLFRHLDFHLVLQLHLLRLLLQMFPNNLNQLHHYFLVVDLLVDYFLFLQLILHQYLLDYHLHHHLILLVLQLFEFLQLQANHHFLLFHHLLL
jgi:hypothetical protein